MATAPPTYGLTYSVLTFDDDSVIFALECPFNQMFCFRFAVLFSSSFAVTYKNIIQSIFRSFLFIHLNIIALLIFIVKDR